MDEFLFEQGKFVTVKCPHCGRDIQVSENNVYYPMRDEATELTKDLIVPCKYCNGLLTVMSYNGILHVSKLDDEWRKAINLIFKQ